ncbi:hypothetical protein QFC22_003533 [Naganishia vaughanmartiniae]|uniref:Uncharacterized protein n=1 Tax=Naganishia vaughanmartiniae TaxID=1424756 RepID=A0ACC2X8E9_9TREE|nr:hypothetical protein QFC22_003533 [Naganishia vaughanmartiniae]
MLITAVTSDGGEDGSGRVTEFSNVDDPLVLRYLRRAGSGVGVSCDVGRVRVEGSLGDINGTISSLLILYSGGSVVFVITSYFALDQAFGITSIFVLPRDSVKEEELVNVAMMASNARLTSGFLNTLLETAASGVLFVAWRSITEDEWYEDVPDLYQEGGKYTYGDDEQMMASRYQDHGHRIV